MRKRDSGTIEKKANHYSYRYWRGRAMSLVIQINGIRYNVGSAALHNAIKQLQAERATAKHQILRYEETEAAVCPEDVGIKEYVQALVDKLASANHDYTELIKERAECVGENGRLREVVETKDIIIGQLNQRLTDIGAQC